MRVNFRSVAHGCVARVVAFVLIGAALPRAAVSAETVVAAAAVRKQDLERHISFLASDTLEGREAGSRGGAAACQYLVGELKKLGLEPAGEDGRYTQDFVPSYRNVLGLLPASGPDACDDVVLIGAHYDHVGYGRSNNSQGPIGYIHNGADDNASGTAAVLEIAEALAASPAPRRCAVLIAFWDAEEINLNGSEHWCARPTIPLSRVRFAINVDMIGRLTDKGAEVHGARSAPGLRARLARANADSDVFLRFKNEHLRNSDHYSFLQRRIPYLLVHTGEHADYHRPTDDIDRLNFDGLVRMTQLLLNLTRASAQQETPAFRRECLRETRRGRSVVRLPQRLGITWKVREAEHPLQITSVQRRSAAERAGLRVGDVLVRFGDRIPQQTADLIDAVAAAESPVTVVVERSGADEPLSVEVKLDGQPVPWGYATSEDDAEPACKLITAIVPKSPAAAAGLEAGDRILEEQSIEGIDAGGDSLALPQQLRLLIERDGRLTEHTLSKH